MREKEDREWWSVAPTPVTLEKKCFPAAFSFQKHSLTGLMHLKHYAHLPTPIPQQDTDVLALPVRPAIFTLLELSPIGSVRVKGSAIVSIINSVYPRFTSSAVSNPIRLKLGTKHQRTDDFENVAAFFKPQVIKIC